MAGTEFENVEFIFLSNVLNAYNMSMISLLHTIINVSYWFYAIIWNVNINSNINGH